MKAGQILDNAELYIGGDMESQEDGDVYRGPIKSISMQYGSVIFELEWCAKMARSEDKDEWEKWHITNSSVNSELEFQAISDNRLFVYIPMMGPMTIFPKGGSQLDPAKVKGLELATN